MKVFDEVRKSTRLTSKSVESFYAPFRLLSRFELNIFSCLREICSAASSHTKGRKASEAVRLAGHLCRCASILEEGKQFFLGVLCCEGRQIFNGIIVQQLLSNISGSGISTETLGAMADSLSGTSPALEVDEHAHKVLSASIAINLRFKNSQAISFHYFGLWFSICTWRNMRLSPFKHGVWGQ